MMAGNAKRNANLDRVRAALGRAFAGYLCDPANAPPPQDPAETAQTREPVSNPETIAEGEADTPPVPERERPQAVNPDVIDEDVTAWCSTLHQSDTDNAWRLIAHFGKNLRVMAQEKARAALYVIWTGTHWDIATGNSRAFKLAQGLGARILEELPYLKPSTQQAKILEAAIALEQKSSDELTAADRKTLSDAAAIQKGLAGARKSRRDFAITSKNKARLESMLACAVPHVLTDPDAFNADHFKVAVKNHTLRFETAMEDEVNPEAERDDPPPGTPETIRVTTSRVVALPGHRRADLITELVPIAYDPKADCPKFRAFMDEFQPDPQVRRMVQVAAGLGLLGVTVQKLFFHYGSGANGKSVFLEVMCRVLGECAVTLPAESFFGGSSGAGSATPDLARLHGRRFLRVQELPEGEDLREDLVKRLTGGEAISVRDLFQGYFDFLPIFTGHMSGNGYPKISGTDNGIWRRMAVVLWPVTIPDERQRNFEEVVSELVGESSGILNWLIEGALIYLREGLVIPEAVTVATQNYRDEMDPTAAFVSAHIVEREGAEITARQLYLDYQAWANANGVKPITETRFGKTMAKKFKRTDGRVRSYQGLMTVDVPDIGDGPQGFDPGWQPEGGR